MLQKRPAAGERAVGKWNLINSIFSQPLCSAIGKFDEFSVAQKAKIFRKERPSSLPEYRRF